MRKNDETVDADAASVPTIVTLEDGNDANVPPFLAGKLQQSSLASSTGASRVVRLSLTRAEVNLMQLLLDTVKLISGDGSVTVRIAGGWVRDKILGMETNDLDVALEGISGVDFAHAIRQHWSALHPDSETAAPNVGVICANPDQSKHLETATMRFPSCGGLDVDFVPLRSDEVYEANSRIPTSVSPSSPLQDSMRRDFTINALYFCPARGAVQDYTGRGLTDLLDAKQLVTPLPAMVTFQDDPLRVLRAIRFAVRLQYPMEASLEEAARSTAVQEAMVSKVSRERVGKEVEGMLSGKAARPPVALVELIRLQLPNVVFGVWDTQHQAEISIMGHVCVCVAKAVPDLTWRQDQADELRRAGWQESTRLLQAVPASVAAAVPSNVQRLFYLALCLWPFSSLEWTDKKGKRQSVVTALMLKESLKFKGKDEKQMSTLLQGAHEFFSLLKEDHWKRGRVGRIVRNCQDLWRTALALATTVGRRDDDDEEEEEEVVQRGQALADYVAAQHLSSCWTWKPLWDGRTLAQELNLPKGPIIGTFMDQQVEWMLQHYQAPEAAAASPPQACLEHLQQVRKVQLETNNTNTKP